MRTTSDNDEEAIEATLDQLSGPYLASADSLLKALVQFGAMNVSHANNRTLLEHLHDTRDIVRAWALPLHVQHAALFHSIYSTPRFKIALVARSDRGGIQNLIGERAEELVFCFSQISYESLAEAVIVSSRTSPVSIRLGAGDTFNISWEKLGYLAFLHIANLADQVTTNRAGPGKWLARSGRLARALRASGVALPPILETIAEKMTPQGESRARACYVKGTSIMALSLSAAADEFRMVTELAPVGEPLFWLAVIAFQMGDLDKSKQLAQDARTRMLALGTAWDKRWSMSEWLDMSETLTKGILPQPAAQVLNKLMPDQAASPKKKLVEFPAMRRERQSDIGEARFNSYIEQLCSRNAGKRRASRYPGLPQMRFHDSRQFPIVAQLESSFEQIRREFKSLNADKFHKEGESIPRIGSWDVYMLYERGKRLDENCDQCPTLSAILSSPDCIRSMSGLIYISRLAPYTRISAHYGPTNMRVRCHMGLSIPEGNCGLEVGGERHHWAEGRCFIFDDSFEHCAWNETDEDRIVLIVDLWHPALTWLEIHRLEGMQSYAALTAPRLIKYWNTNATLRKQRSRLYD